MNEATPPARSRNEATPPARSRNEATPSGSHQPPARFASTRSARGSASARFARPFTAPRFVAGASPSGPSTSGAPSSVSRNYTRLMSFFTASGNHWVIE